MARRSYNIVHRMQDYRSVVDGIRFTRNDSKENLHGFKRRSNAMVGNRAGRQLAAVASCDRVASFQPGKGHEGIPISAAAAAACPFGRFLLAGGADVWHDHAFLELERLLEFDDG